MAYVLFFLIVAVISLVVNDQSKRKVGQTRFRNRRKRRRKEALEKLSDDPEKKADEQESFVNSTILV